jgi:hypothetical protein
VCPSSGTRWHLTRLSTAKIAAVKRNRVFPFQFFTLPLMAAAGTLAVPLTFSIQSDGAFVIDKYGYTFVRTR